jgi:phage gp36-like protein
MAYATPADFAVFGLSYPWLRPVPVAVQQRHLDAASIRIDGYLRKRFTLPLVSYGDDLTLLTCQVAACSIAHVRGFDPQGQDGQVIRSICEAAQADLKRIEEGTWLPAVTDSSSGAEEGVESHGGLEIESSQPRGWDRPANARTYRAS